MLFAGKYHITLRCVTKKYFSNTRQRRPLPHYCKFNTTPFQVQCCLLCKGKVMLCGKLKGVLPPCVKKCLHSNYFFLQKSKQGCNVICNRISHTAKIIGRIAIADLCFTNGLWHLKEFSSFQHDLGILEQKGGKGKTLTIFFSRASKLVQTWVSQR